MITVGIYTFRELIRQRMIHIVLFIAILLFGVSFLASTLSIEEGYRIIFHFGFTAVQLSLVGISMLLGSTLIAKEVERQTCLLVLSRPITRTQFFIGKWLGIAAINFCNMLLLTVLLWLIVGVKFSLLKFIQIGLGTYFESLILLSVAFFMTQVVRSAVGLFFTLGVFLLGHWLNDLVYFAEKSKIDSFKVFANIIHDGLPQLYRMDWRSFYILEKVEISGLEFLGVSLHSVGWIVLLLMLGAWSFRRKDLV